jgi:HAD superfamily hydrolase (TIGR01490 family)
MGRVAAMFDMDKTLLDTNSSQLYARFMYRAGELSRLQLARVAWWSGLSRLGFLDMHSLVPKLLADAAGDNEPELRSLCDRWFEEDVVPHIAERGRQKVEEHRAQGHVLAIVSASTQYAVGPMASHLGFPGQYVCTHLESQNGVLTGELVPPVCFGEGKIVWAERFAAEHGVDLAASYFYTDSITDLPLMEVVAHPVAVNPDPRLRRLAGLQGWPIEMFY